MRQALTARWSSPPAHRPCVVFTDDRGWSIYGAERSQPVAIGGKWECPENGEIRPKPLPPVASGCRSERMVRRGSTVPVRQRALQKPRIKRLFIRINLQVRERGAGMEP